MSGLLNAPYALSRKSVCWFGLSSILSSATKDLDSDNYNNGRKDSQYESADDQDEIQDEDQQQQQQHVTKLSSTSRYKKNVNAVKNAQGLQEKGLSDRSARLRKRSQLKKAGEQQVENTATDESHHHNTQTQGHHPQKLCSYADAPPYLKFNPDITGGYRLNISPWECGKSVFWWTNETLNIWTHFLGWIFFLCLSVYDSFNLLNMATIDPWDRVIVAFLLICFQLSTMSFAAAQNLITAVGFPRIYLESRSVKGLLGVYVSGIYYAFSCISFWLHFYMITVAAIFALAMGLQIIPIVNRPTTKEAFRGRLIVFGGWGAYGILPMFHWAVLHGGMSSPIVALLLPRIFWMYGISVAAFFFFVLRVPEKLWPGLVDYVGSSHQIWHILIVAALYHWHNTGVLYLEFRANNSCQAEYAFLFPSGSGISVDDDKVAQTHTLVET